MCRERRTINSKVLLFVAVTGTLLFFGCKQASSVDSASRSNDSEISASTESSDDGHDISSDSDVGAKDNRDTATDVSDTEIDIIDTETDIIDTDTSESVCASWSTGSQCDGLGVDCYSECWECAVAGECADAMNHCMTNDACAAFSDCLEGCEGLEDDDTSNAWSACAHMCTNVEGFNTAVLHKYNNIKECIGCSTCVASCGCETEHFFTIQLGSSCNLMEVVNAIGVPCYHEDAEENETACFFWAGWGGPCTSLREACDNNIACNAFEGCYYDQLATSSPSAAQAQCETEHPDGIEDFLAFLRCIYCDACNYSCFGETDHVNCER